MAWHGWSRRTEASMATRRASEGIITVERVRRSDGWSVPHEASAAHDILVPLTYVAVANQLVRTNGWDSTTLRISACILKIPIDSASHVKDHRPYLSLFSTMASRIESNQIKSNQAIDR